ADGRDDATGSSRTAVAVGCGSVSSGSCTSVQRGRRLSRRPGAKMPQSVAHRLDTPRGSAGKQKLADERIELAVEHRLGVSHLVAGARVLDHLIRVQNVGADGLAAEAGVRRTASFLRQ